MSVQGHRNLYLYLGRRGALTQWMLEIATLTAGNAVSVISKQNESFDQICAIGADIVTANTFDNNLGAIFRSYRIVSLQRLIAQSIARYRITRVINLMPHVWTPLLANVVHDAGAQYVVIVHDASPHPGDSTGQVHWWLVRDALKADHVITLSRHVAGQLTIRFPHLRERVKTLFLPSTGPLIAQKPTGIDRPLRFLFFGRILPYKGIRLFLEACESLRRQKLPFDVSVFGEGELGDLRPRLEAMDATIVNRWISDRDVASMMEAHDVIVVPSLEASQSGVVSTAFAASRPVIVTPVGGLVEQVNNGRTGLVTDAVSGDAVAAQMRRLILDRDLCISLAANVRAVREETSMRRFLDALDRI
jgi:glycosyltransferase involved in cell wall biosynthesis